jgi:hypothetical protein
MYCTNCGNLISAKHQYCTKCGNSILRTKSTINLPEEKSVETMAFETDAAPKKIIKIKVSQYGAEVVNHKTQTHFSGKSIIKNILAWLFMILISLSCYYYYVTRILKLDFISYLESKYSQIVDGKKVLVNDFTTDFWSVKKRDIKSNIEIKPINFNIVSNQIAFSKNGLIYFYFDRVNNQGRINIDNQFYNLNYFNSTEEFFEMKGDNNIKILTSKPISEDRGGDCSYGKFAVVKIFDGYTTTEFENFEYQDCPALE